MKRSKKSRQVPDKLIGHLEDVFSTLTRATTDVIEAVEEESTAAMRRLTEELSETARRSYAEPDRRSDSAQSAAYETSDAAARAAARRAAGQNVSRHPPKPEAQPDPVDVIDPLDLFFDLIDDRPFSVVFRPGRSMPQDGGQLDAAFRASGKVGCVYTVHGDLKGQERGSWAAGEDADGVFMTITLGDVHGVLSVAPHPRVRTQVLLTVLEGVFGCAGMVGTLDLHALRSVPPEG